MGERVVFVFAGWQPALRVLLVGTLAYVALLAMLRVSGKRTLGKMNIFDFIMTVAIGSTLANVLTNAEVALVEGLTAFAVLIGLQMVFALLTLRSSRLETLINGRPRLLFYRGEFRDDVMRRERVTREEVLAAVRASGAPCLEEVDAVVLETDGIFSVLRDVPSGRESSLRDVAGIDAPDARAIARTRPAPRGDGGVSERADALEPRH